MESFSFTAEVNDAVESKLSRAIAEFRSYECYLVCCMLKYWRLGYLKLLCGLKTLLYFLPLEWS